MDNSRANSGLSISSSKR